MPSHSRDDTGRLAPVDLHGDSKIADANTTDVTDERAVQPIETALSDGPRPGQEAIEPPRFADMPAPSIPAAPSTPTGQSAATTSVDASVDADAGHFHDVVESPPSPAVIERPVPQLPSLPPSLPPWLLPWRPLLTTNGPSSRSAAALANPTPPSEEPLRPKTPAAIFPLPLVGGKSSPSAESLTVDREPAPEVDVLALIRVEIKQRLSYFQGCARSAQRRGGMDVRRLQATWAISADGSVTEMKLDGVADAQLAACILRVGNRPFAVQPGIDLIVPTPIVFVR